MERVTALVRKSDGAIITDGSAIEDAEHIRIAMPRSPDGRLEQWDFEKKTLRPATREEVAEKEAVAVTKHVEWMVDSNPAISALRDAVADILKIDRAALRQAQTDRLLENQR